MLDTGFVSGSYPRCFSAQESLEHFKQSCSRPQFEGDDLASLRDAFRVGRCTGGICMKARTTKTLIATASGLFNIIAAMIEPCSVKALGR